MVNSENAVESNAQKILGLEIRSMLQPMTVYWRLSQSSGSGGFRRPLFVTFAPDCFAHNGWAAKPGADRAA